ncbi:VirK family protein [Ralstonia syzygii subsp. celebesensis]|uniref:Signal peptidase n=3 Tax=Ralstonia solanacearum species complex TaxID=3116862 RepID=A0AAD0WFG3_RALSL|nr:MULTISPECIES: VirK family protein [Ralstonia solanacearum species complex]CCA79565.1 conserved exported hypothetical protein, virk domain [blood disease bacterium R229]AQW29255.1 signal peptidase [blood disease bacterium A2-HR MARDI]AXV80959.1 signal peptidase [Ralstonia solanacearum]AXW52103.1 signal peptidase [Ralstonia solanacearum]QQV56874.1 VirK family protein [Ralstonia syzygii subsp. celebesensis]
MAQTNMKPIACIFAAFTALPVLVHAQTVPLPDVLAAEQALSLGKPVTATIDLTRCTGDTDTTPPGTTRGGVSVNPYRIQPNNTLSFSDTHFTVRSDGTPITQFLRYTIDATGTARFASYIFAMPSYTLQSQVSYTCKLGEGVKLFAQF